MKGLFFDGALDIKQMELIIDTMISIYSNVLELLKKRNYQSQFHRRTPCRLLQILFLH